MPGRGGEKDDRARGAEGLVAAEGDGDDADGGSYEVAELGRGRAKTHDGELLLGGGLEAERAPSERPAAGEKAQQSAATPAETRTATARPSGSCATARNQNVGATIEAP
jgi:hypothetical protein